MDKKYLRWGLCISGLLLLLLFSILLALSIGEIYIPIPKLIQVFTEKKGMEYTIIQNIRLPRAILGLAVGGSLGLAGVILQGVYRNPLVEPYTLGISGGAALGVALSIVFGIGSIFGSWVLPVSGFSGAFVAVFWVYLLSVRRHDFSINKMLLIGVMISFIASSALMFLMATTTTENLNSIIFWIMGSLDEPDIRLIYIVLFSSLFSLLVAYLLAQPLNALRLGEAKARHLGINSTIIVRILFVLASLLTGICVAVAGVIGFVGLVIPHIVRMFGGSDNRVLLAGSYLGGSIFIILCDIVARTIISPNELPIGVITGMVGGVVFILVLSNSKAR
jgi:iron complex transport system permease protein